MTDKIEYTVRNFTLCTFYKITLGLRNKKGCVGETSTSYGTVKKLLQNT
jgi:hypothetical protein